MMGRPASRGRPTQPVHDGEAEALLGDGLDEDTLDAGRVELPEYREEIAGIGPEVARHGPHREPRAIEGDWALGHQGHGPAGLEPGGDDRLPRSALHDDDLGAGGIVA